MTAATPPPVLVTTETGILRIQLRRPDKKNAITAAMYLTMINAIRQAEQDPGLFNAFEIRHLTHFLRLRCLMSLRRNCLAAIPDPRRAQGKMYDLPHLLLFSILAVASGATSYRRVHQFIATHWQRLNLAFGCRWKRAPAYTSIRYALQGLAATAVERAFRTHARALAGEPKTARPVIAIDGKTLRGSLDRFEDRKAVQVLNALAGDSQLVLGHLLIENADKDHEIQAAQRLIRELDLSGRLYTLDALHLQKTL